MIKNLYTTLLLCCMAWAPLSAQLSIVEIMYNNPGEDLYEYVKVWNNSGQDINLNGYSMSEGMEATFPDVTISSNEWFFVVADSTSFVNDLNTFGYEVIQATGALNNGGETITIIDANAQVVDQVTYDDGNGWPTFADGNGSSLHYCGTSGQDKNDPELWNLTPATLGLEIDDQPLYGLLGDIFFQCTERGVTSFFNNRISVLENAGTVTIPIYINRAEQSVVELEVASTDGTAVLVDDFSLASSMVSSDTDTMDVFFIELAINDDAQEEGDETFTLSFPAFSDQYLSLTNTIEITIIDNDTPLTENLILTGVWDAQPGFSGTKGAEFYAINDIPDLSIFGVGVVNNGNGTDGVEFTFPAESITAGTYIYLAEDEGEFTDYFGFAPNYTFTQINVNGDDAIELFENAQPLDVFGDANLDGTGTGWEYLDGWAYRQSGTLQDGDTFVEANWTYGGIDALDGPATNAEASNPFPIGTYSTTPSTEVIGNADSFTFPAGTTLGTVDVLANDQIPATVTVTDILIEVPATDLTLSINPDFTIDFTAPDGFCGSNVFSYLLFTDVGTQEVGAMITIECAPEFPLLDIAQVTVEDTDGIATEVGTTCELIGNVYGVNLSSTGVLFTIIDDNGDGIAVFNNDSDLGYTVTEGDVVSVRGEITQFNGLTEIVAAEIELFGTGATLLAPREVSALDESTESNLVQLTEVTYTDISEWGGGFSGFNYTVTDGTNEFEIRIDNDVELFVMAAPGDELTPMNITGLGGQFDNMSPFTDSYQLLPRYAADIEIDPNTVDRILGTKVDIFPNPASRILTINTEDQLDEVRISDALGRLMIQTLRPDMQSEINVQSLTPGIYTVQFLKGENTFAMKLIVQ